jgi:hypothetical protein
MLYQSHLTGKYVLMNKRGRRRMLLPVASVWKHPKSQYWTACFRDQNGAQRRISTKETSNKKALKIAEKFERAAKTKRTLKQVQNSGERGVGRGKNEFLDAAHGKAISVMRAIRNAIDPDGVRLTEGDFLALFHTRISDVQATE